MNGVGGFGFNQLFSVPFGPRGIHHEAIATAQFPKLFGHVRRIWGDQSRQRLKQCPLVGFGFGEFIHTDHHGADHSVPAQAIQVFSDFFDRFVQSAFPFRRGLPVVNQDFAIGSAVQSTQLPQKPMNPVDALGVPRLGLFQGSKEHLVAPEGVSPITLDEVIGVLDVEFGLGHLLHLAPTSVFAFFIEGEFSIGEFRSPRPKSIEVKDVILNQRDVDVQTLGAV